MQFDQSEASIINQSIHEEELRIKLDHLESQIALQAEQTVKLDEAEKKLREQQYVFI